MGIRTQGTHLYFIDTITSSAAEVVKLTCPTGISGLGGARDQIDSTCLDATGDKTFLAGLGNPGQVSVPFNLDPTAADHAMLFQLKEDGRNLDWLACLSESATEPTLDSNEAFALPADRSCIAFSAYVADVNIDMATNEIVRGTLTLQRSGNVVFTPYVPA